MIIVYSEEEEEATLVARKMIERGIENVFLLSGGLFEFQELLEGDYIDGDVRSLPSYASYLQKMKTSPKKNNKSKRSTSSRNSSSNSGHSSQSSSRRLRGRDEGELKAEEKGWDSPPRPFPSRIKRLSKQPSKPSSRYMTINSSRQTSNQSVTDTAIVPRHRHHSRRGSVEDTDMSNSSVATSIISQAKRKKG